MIVLSSGSWTGFPVTATIARTIKRCCANYLYDDHLKILYNANGKEERISLAELESSTLFSRGAPCFVDKNAVHGKNLGKNIVFRGFLLLFGQKRDFYAPSKQVSILCCLLIVFHAKQDLNPAIFRASKFFCLKTYKISLTE